MARNAVNYDVVVVGGGAAGLAAAVAAGSAGARTALIERYGFRVLRSRVDADGRCPDCRKPIPGIWGPSSGHGDGRVRPLL